MDGIEELIADMGVDRAGSMTAPIFERGSRNLEDASHVFLGQKAHLLYDFLLHISKLSSARRLDCQHHHYTVGAPGIIPGQLTQAGSLVSIHEKCFPSARQGATCTLLNSIRRAYP